MAWNSFKLGRPGYENTFALNPKAVSVDEAQIASSNRVLSGKLKKWVFRTSFPTIQLSQSFFTVTERNVMASLLSVTDTFLSFIVNDALQTIGEQVPVSNVGTQVTLQENSATLLSAARVAAGAAGTITVNGVYDNPGLTGTNYYSGGSYDDATRVVTLGTALAAQQYVYATYTYTGWLVEMRAIPYTAIGGQVDVMGYGGWTLTGV